jgi:hypothetical protein
MGGPILHCASSRRHTKLSACDQFIVNTVPPRRREPTTGSGQHTATGSGQHTDRISMEPQTHEPTRKRECIRYTHYVLVAATLVPPEAGSAIIVWLFTTVSFAGIGGACSAASPLSCSMLSVPASGNPPASAGGSPFGAEAMCSCGSSSSWVGVGEGVA